MLGLGSILGTGIFVSVGIAAGVAGPSVIIAIALAGCVAACNALSAAQLAAAHPLSGGTYEYGYKYLTPLAGWTAGWVFLLAKSASAATAALGFAGYAQALTGSPRASLTALACGTTAVVSIFVLAGIRKSSGLNLVIVSVTLVALLGFIAAAGLHQIQTGAYTEHFTPFFSGDNLLSSTGNVFHATALMFVAFAGYARITTLAEEVRNPKRTIPTAIIATLIVTVVLYMGVTVAGVGSVGADFLSGSTTAGAAPLAAAAEQFGHPLIPILIAGGAAAAMLGVLLNLLLGLSRVLLAMGRRRDMPGVLARVSGAAVTPWPAVLVAAAAVASLTLLDSVKTTWSFSAFTILIYYAITNIAALKLPLEQRLYPRWTAVAGLASCLLLAFQVDADVWVAGLGVIAAGIAWYYCAQWIKLRTSPATPIP